MARAVRIGGRILLGLLAVMLVAAIGFRTWAWVRESGAETPVATTLVPTPQGRVAVAMAGPKDGPPVLLVHGTAAWSGFWSEVSAHLAARGWRVIAVDLPPFGYSDHDPAGRYDRATQAARLSAVLKRVAQRPAVVVGHSFGAGAATELALAAPGQVRSLVLVDAALGTLDPAGGNGAFAGALGLGWIASPLTAALVTNPVAIGPMLRSMIERDEAAAQWLDVLRQPMRREGTTGAYADWLPALFVADDGSLSRRTRNLAAIRVPVAIIWGTADTVTPIGQGARLATLMRARSYTKLPGVGHIPHIEVPREFMAALDAAIDQDRVTR